MLPNSISSWSGPWQPVLATSFASKGLLGFMGYRTTSGPSAPELLLYDNSHGGPWTLDRVRGAPLGYPPVLDFLSPRRGFLLVRNQSCGAMLEAIKAGRSPVGLVAGRWLQHVSEIDFLNSRQGWAVANLGTKSVLLKTTNGGRSWHPISVAASFSLSGPK